MATDPSLQPRQAPPKFMNKEFEPFLIGMHWVIDGPRKAHMCS